LDWIVRHEVQLLINRNYNKIQEEYDSGINYLRGWMIYSTSKLDAEKEPIQVQLARAWWCVLSNTQAWRVQLYHYKCMTCATVQLRLKSGLLMTNQIQEFWYSFDCYYYYQPQELLKILLLACTTIIILVHVNITITMTIPQLWGS